MICFDCEIDAENIHMHHVVPKSKGGTKMVPLCESCHGKVHGKSMLTSELTREALRKAKERGVKLGKPENLTPEAREKGLKAMAKRRTELCREHYKELYPEIKKLRDSGMTFLQIAECLNANGYKTRNGYDFKSTTVQRIIKYFQ